MNIPFGKRVMLSLDVNPSLTHKLEVVRIKDRVIHTRFINTNFVVRKALSRVQVDDKDEACSFKDDYLVVFMFPGNIGRMSR